MNLGSGANAVILNELRRKGGTARLNLKVLSAQSSFKHGTVSHALHRLQREGFVKIEEEGAGLRSPLVSLCYQNINLLPCTISTLGQT